MTDFGITSKAESVDAHYKEITLEIFWPRTAQMEMVLGSLSTMGN